MKLLKNLIAVVVLAVSSLPALAELTTAQYQTLATHIRANTDPVVVAALTTGSFGVIAGEYNKPSASQCWRSSFSQSELLDTINWTVYIGRSVAERDALRTMFASGRIDARRDNVRQGFADIFSGTATPAVAQRAALTDAIQRTCTIAERMFATGAGPYVMTFEGQLPHTDVSDALERY